MSVKTGFIEMSEAVNTDVVAQEEEEGGGSSGPAPSSVKCLKDKTEQNRTKKGLKEEAAGCRHADHWREEEEEEERRRHSAKKKEEEEEEATSRDRGRKQIERLNLRRCSHVATPTSSSSLCHCIRRCRSSKPKRPAPVVECERTAGTRREPRSWNVNKQKEKQAP